MLEKIKNIEPEQSVGIILLARFCCKVEFIV